MNWKLITMAASAIATLGLSAGPAMAGTAGTVTMGAGHTWQETANAEDQDNAFANIFGGAKINIPYSQTVNLQLDAFADAAFANQLDDNNYGTGFGLAAHINYRDADGLLGVFGALGRTSGIDENTASFTAFGFEGQYYAGSWTVLGTLGYLDAGEDFSSFSPSSYLNSAGFVQLGANYYASKTLRLSGTVAYANGEQNADDVELWDWTLGAEYLFSPKVPASLFAEYRGVQSEDDAGMELKSAGVNVGIRIHFGATDLVSSDREGASASLPAIQRWVSEGGEALD